MPCVSPSPNNSLASASSSTILAALSATTIGSPTFSITIPRLLSYMATGSFKGEVQGLNQLQAEEQSEFGPGNYMPNVRVAYWSMRVMAMLGVLRFLIGAVGAWLYRKRRLEKARWYLWTAVVARLLNRRRPDIPLTGELPFSERLPIATLALGTAAGLVLAIATTTTPDNVTALLRHSLAPDGAEWFALIAAGDIVPAKKPASDIYIWALEKLGLAAEDCLAFEDSGNGIRSSMGAGLRTVVTVNDYTREDDFSGAAAVLSDLGEPGAPFTRVDREERGLVDLARLRAWFQG